MSSEGDRLRDEGTARVASHNVDWMTRALIAVCNIPKGTLLMGEDLRRVFYEKPKHSNAWGALTRTAVLRGFLVDTGEVRKSRRASAHSRRNPVYRRT